MIEMPAATAAVMACIQAAESRLVIAALAAVGPAWLSVGRAMVKVLARSSLLSGANTRRMRPTVCRPDRDHRLTDGPIWHLHDVVAILATVIDDWAAKAQKVAMAEDARLREPTN
jgi:hypothetical protein